MRLKLSHVVDMQIGCSMDTAAGPEFRPRTDLEYVVANNGTDGILVLEFQRVACPGASATVALAVVVWLGGGDLRIFQSGNHHDVKFPFEITGLHVPDVGLIIEAQHGILQQKYKRLYSLSQPQGTIHPIAIPDQLRGKSWGLATGCDNVVVFGVHDSKGLWLFDLTERKESEIKESFIASPTSDSKSFNKSTSSGVDMSVTEDQFLDDDLFAKEAPPKAIDDLTQRRGSSMGIFQYGAASGGSRRSSFQSSQHRYSSVSSQRRVSSSFSPTASKGPPASPPIGNRSSAGGGEGGRFDSLIGIDNAISNFNTASLIRQASSSRMGAHFDSPIDSNIHSNRQTQGPPDSPLGYDDADASFLRDDYPQNGTGTYLIQPALDVINNSADMSVASLRTHYSEMVYANRSFSDFSMSTAEYQLEFIGIVLGAQEITSRDIQVLRSVPCYGAQYFITILLRSSGLLERYKVVKSDGDVLERVLSLSDCISCTNATIRGLPTECILVTRVTDCVAVTGSHILGAIECADDQTAHSLAPITLKCSFYSSLTEELTVVAEIPVINSKKMRLGLLKSHFAVGGLTEMSRRFIAAASQELEEHVYISIAQIMFKAMENSDIVAIILIACMWSAFMQSFSGILVEFDEYMRTFCAVLELKTSNLDTVHSFMTNLPAKMLPTVFDIALLISEDVRLMDDWAGKSDSLRHLVSLRRALALIATLGTGAQWTTAYYFADVPETSQLITALLGPGVHSWKPFEFSVLSRAGTYVPSSEWLSSMIGCFTTDATKSSSSHMQRFRPYPGVLSGRRASWLPTLTRCCVFLQELWHRIESAGEHAPRVDLVDANIPEYVVKAFMSTEGGDYTAVVDAIKNYPSPLGLLISVALFAWSESLKPSLEAYPCISPGAEGIDGYLDALFLLSRHDIVLNALSSIRAVSTTHLFAHHGGDGAKLTGSASMIRALCASPVSKWIHVLRNTSRMVSKANEPSVQGIDPAGINRGSDDAEGLSQLIASTYSRFPEDERVREACKLLCSTKEMSIRVVRAPDMDDAAFKAKLQQKLLYYCRRAFAASVGRGMATLGSLGSIMTEPLRLPTLAVTGRVPPMNSVLHIDSLSPELLIWPEFHCGVAAGLRIQMASDGSLSDVLKPSYLSPKDASVEQLRELLSSLDEQSGHKGAMRYWILYNRSTQGAAAAAENGHAGTLLALGMLGHLKALTIIDICEYLVSGRQTTSIGVLLGVAASHMCSCDTVISKTLYLHIPSLIPRSSSSEIEVPVIVQCAAITGLGLLYCGSGNRSMAEFLLSELHRRPPCEKGTDSGEAFALSAAWALGMVCIGRGGIGTPNLDGSTVSNFSPASVDIFDSLHDLKLDERLLRCITGEMGSLGESDFKAKQSGKGIFANSYTNDSSTRGLLVLEPEGLVNTVFTSFGAIIALALIFIHSNSESIASRLRPPSTCFGLETERPDLLCMRSLAVRLINWTETENVCSSTSTARDVATWLENQVPEVLHEWVFDPCHRSSSRGLWSNSMMSNRAAAVAYLSIITGSCMGLALVHAGTGNGAVRDVLVGYLSMLLRLRGGKMLRFQKQRATSKEPSIIPENYSVPFMKLCTEHKSAKMLVEMFFSCMCLSVGVVMSGTGDVDALRVLREARMKSEESSYGTLMAISMSTGMLFLCGGKAAFRRDPISVGLLLLSICPWFPNRTADNRAHLQATRHFYAMAVEWRWLRCVDLETGADVAGALVEVHLLSGAIQSMKAPCLLPELASLVRITSKSPDYHDAELCLGLGGSAASRPSDYGAAREGVSSTGPLVMYLKRAVRTTNSSKVSRRVAMGDVVCNGKIDPLIVRHATLEESLRHRLSLKIACSRPVNITRQRPDSSQHGKVPSARDNMSRIQAEALRSYTYLEEALTSQKISTSGPYDASRQLLAQIASSGSVFRGLASHRIDLWTDATRVADVLPYSESAAMADISGDLRVCMKSIAALGVRAVRSAHYDG